MRRGLRAGHAPTWRHADRGTGILNPHHGYLKDHWRTGRRKAVLWRELLERASPGAVQRCAGLWNPGPEKRSEPPTPRRAVRLLAGDTDRGTDGDHRLVQSLRERSPPLATAADLVIRFCRMVKGKVPDPFEGWLCEAEARTLALFAAGIPAGDEDAVRAALSGLRSSGQVEGQANRLKVIKRAMFGRAGFELLRGRVLAHA